MKLKRRNATRSGAVWRLELILLLSAALGPLSLRAEAPIERFVIGVWSPAGWSGADYDSYDRFFMESDADSLAELGVNLLVQTPRIGNKDKADYEDDQDAHEIMQDLEEAIIDSFKAHGGLVVEQSAEEELDEEDPEPGEPTTYTSRVPFGHRLIDYAGVSSDIDEHKLEQQAIALSGKWGNAPYEDGFFGYFIGHEQYPNWYNWQSGGFQGGIYDSATYTNLGKVIAAIRRHDTERAIVAVGSVNDIGAWTEEEQEAFRKVFFRPNTESGPANILMNEQYIFDCATDTEVEVQAFLDRLTALTVDQGSLTRTRDMVNEARRNNRKAEWYHIINVNHEYRLGYWDTNNEWVPNACWTGAKYKTMPHDPFRRRPNKAELSVQAYMALVRGATGIVYYSHTTNGIREMTGYDDPDDPDDNVPPATSSCVEQLADETRDSLREMPTCASDLTADWETAKADTSLGTNWYFGLMRFSPNYERNRKKSAMFDTVKAVNQKLKVIGDALYPEVSMGEHRPLTWDANYDNFSSTNGLSATTLVDAVWPNGWPSSTAAGKLEFGQFHNGEADYVLVVNRATDTSQTLDLRFDVAQMASDDAGSGAFQVEDVSVVSVVNGTPSTLVADASGNVTVTGQTLAAGDARLYRIVRVDQPGMVSLSSTAPTVDHPVTATLSDPDFPVRDEVWQWQRRQPDGTWEPVRPGLLGSPSPSSPSYRPTVRDLDRPLRATVRYRDRLSSAEFVLPDKSAQSAATSPVEWGLDPVLTVAPLASGSVRFKVALPAPVESRSPEPEPGEDLLSLAEIDLEACTRTNGVRSCPWHRGDEIGQLVSGAPGSRGVSSGITFTATPVASVEEGPGAGSQLYNGQTYRFRARLLGPEGQPSAASDSVTVLGLRAEGRDGSVVLSWDTPPIAGVTGWAYRHRPADGSWEEGDWQPIPGSGEATTTASVEGLSNGVAHWFQVRAVLAMGSGPESFVVSATPDTPGRVTVRPTQPRVGETLKATLVDPDTPVEVTGWRWRRLASWDRSADIDSASAPPSSERWTQVVGRTRKYKPVKADLGRRLRVEVDYTDRSGAQGARTTTPAVQAGPPCAPPDLAAAAGDEDGQVELTWAAACNHGSAIRQYQYQHLGASAWEPVSGDGSARRQVVDGLTAGQTYAFQVRARNGVGPGPPSQVTVALPDPDPPDDPPPPRPGTITLEPSIARTCARLTATLRDPDGGIDLEPSHSPTTEPTFTYGWVWDPRSFPSDGPASAATSVTQDHIPPNSSVGRFIEVTARYGDNRSDRNEVLVRSGTVVANTPRTPGRLAGAAGDGQVDLSWTAPNDCGSDITHYDYRVRPNPSGAWSAWQDTTATSVTVSPLTNDVEYTFEVRAHNGRGASRVAAITRRPLSNTPDPDATLTLTADDPPYLRTAMIANFSHPGAGTVTGWAWYRLTAADQEESSDNHITGQITNRYVPREADLNHWIRVIATYNDHHAQGRTVAATTAQAVQRGDDGGTITFTGIDPPLVNREITATLHDDDNPTNLAWQWDVAGAAGARPEGRIDEGNTYTPGSGHVGSRIRAQVIYDDDFGRNKIVRNTTPGVQASSTLTLREISKQRWTPIFGQLGSGVKVDSMRFIRLPVCILPWVCGHRRGSSAVVSRCSS